MTDHAHGAEQRSVLLGVSLKMYLDVDESALWARQIASIAGAHSAVAAGDVRVFVLPSLPALPGVLAAIGDAPVAAGAQDLFWADRGAYTGGVSGVDLKQLGCRYVEVGHAERRQAFGEDAEITRLKFAAAVRNDLTPVLCVGETDESSADAAAETCIAQLEHALSGVDFEASDTQISELVVAYEPEWAIGRAEPAGAGHVAAVAARLRAHLDSRTGIRISSVIYGGSAKPGLLSVLGNCVDGLFLGRFAHDTSSFSQILDEAAAVIR